MNLMKAFIVDKKDNTYKVRIPQIHGLSTGLQSVADSDLPYAAVSSISGLFYNLKKNDIVFVFFENNESEHPVILGSLYLENDSSLVNHIVDFKKLSSQLKLSALTVEDKVKLPYDTHIGNVSKVEISYLSGVKSNLQNQINNILETNTFFKTVYHQKDYQQLNQWKLNDRGFILSSDLVDESKKEISTYPYVRTSNLETGILSKDNYKEVTIDGETVQAFYTDGYNKDARMRLNWMGSNVVQNDTMKVQTGLYSRNYWGVHAVQDGSTFKLFSEYTFKPSVQGYVKNNSLDEVIDNYPVQPVSIAAQNTSGVQKYQDTWRPYYLFLNPDGGDIYLGRNFLSSSGKQGVKIIDNDVFDSETETYKQQHGIEINGITITAEDGILYQDDGTKKSKLGSGSGAGSSFFTYTTNDDEMFVTPFVSYLQKNRFEKERLYEQYTSDEDDSRLRSGFVTFEAELLIGINDSGIQHYLPVTAKQTIQLGTLLDLGKDINSSQVAKSVIVDMFTQIGYKWENIDFHFMLSVFTEYDKIEDKIRFNIKNTGNYLSFVNLREDNVIKIYKAQLVQTLFVSGSNVYVSLNSSGQYEHGYYPEFGYLITGGNLRVYTNSSQTTYEQYPILTGTTGSYTGQFISNIPVRLNVSAQYSAIDIEENITESSVVSIDNPTYSEDIGG